MIGLALLAAAMLVVLALCRIAGESDDAIEDYFDDTARRR